MNERKRSPKMMRMQKVEVCRLREEVIPPYGTEDTS